MTEPPQSSMRRDLISAYALTLARVAAWVVVSGAVYRGLGAPALAMVTLVRATLGVLSYISLGLGPAMVRRLAEASAPVDVTVAPLADSPAKPVRVESIDAPLLAYAEAPPAPKPNSSVLNVYETGNALAFGAGLVAIAVAFIYANHFDWMHRSAIHPDFTVALAGSFGLGIVLRLIGEAPSGLLQARGKIALDNMLGALTEIAWAITALAMLGVFTRTSLRVSDLPGVGYAYALANLALLFARHIAANVEARQMMAERGRFDGQVAWELLGFGSLIVLAQVADYLYAPVDCILINWLIDPSSVAYYAPAIQIDAGLLLLVSGMAAVLFPRSALAHARGQHATLRQYYIRGTLAGVAILVPASLVVLAGAPWVMRLWFDDPMTPTRAILPLVLIHTVVGGSSAVGRSILLGMGKVKPFTISVLLAGVGNVVLSYIFVRHLDLGLKGIVYGTIVVVVLRCGVWMPWYVLRSLK